LQVKSCEWKEHSSGYQKKEYRLRPLLKDASHAQLAQNYQVTMLAAGTFQLIFCVFQFHQSKSSPLLEGGMERITTMKPTAKHIEKQLSASVA